ncbi:MAG TPA: hypothetical protein HPP77_09800 [Candidatus Hydrogenedentes bacterium]|nr:hypothetical protein [Candidatus Hydrogenedentota bacterium]
MRRAEGFSWPVCPSLPGIWVAPSADRERGGTAGEFDRIWGGGYNSAESRLGNALVGRYAHVIHEA